MTDRFLHGLLHAGQGVCTVQTPPRRQQIALIPGRRGHQQSPCVPQRSVENTHAGCADGARLNAHKERRNGQ